MAVAWHQLAFIFLSPKIPYECEDVPGHCPENCTKYIFNSSIFNNSINMDFGLVCSSEWMADIAQSSFMLGVLVGNMIFGILADRYGRKNPLVIALFIQTVAGIAASFSSSWAMFVSIRFLFALCNGGTMVISFVIVMEVVGVQYRQIFGMFYQIFFVMGHASLAGIAALTTESWSQLQLWLSLPMLPFLIYYFLLPESPRWLIARGNTEEAIAVLKKGAIRNGMDPSNVETCVRAMPTKAQEDPKTSNNIIDLFKTPVLRQRTIFMTFGWLSCGIYFYGVSQLVSQQTDNIFLNVAISALIQLPGNLLATYLNRAIGRKKTLIGSYLLSGVFMLGECFMPVTWHVAESVCSMVGLVGMSLAFPTIYLYSGELFPTVLRNTGLGLCIVVSRIGSMLSPFVVSIAIKAWISPLIFGGLMLLSILTVLILPETQGKSLPSSVEDAEKFGTKT